LGTLLPDVILLDVMMPGMDGYEVCRWVRSNAATAHVPVVMLSGKADPESVAHGLEVGADEYLAKPITPSNLTAHLKTVLTRTAARS
jgi:DNA-binding response OmpR family regulator